MIAEIYGIQREEHATGNELEQAIRRARDRKIGTQPITRLERL